jgi:hypothetical protein
VAKLLARASVIVVLGLAACSRGEQPAPSSTQAASGAAFAGPQGLVLRVPRNGGAPRVTAYPRVDSVAWFSPDPAPAPQTILAFDDESGSVAYEDVRGRPVLLELRLGTITITSNKKLTGLASANGKAIYGIGEKGDVVRMTPTGDWTFKPPQPAKAVFPQSDGTLLVALGQGANTRLIKLFPPDTRILDSLPFPVAMRTVRSQLGDRLYLAVDSGLVVLRTRTMDWGPPITLSEPISVMVSTPSGDRVFALTQSKNEISVIDRFREQVTATFALPGKANDLRVDPFGRYLIARAADKDSVWVIAIGTERIIGALRSAWRADLPYVAYDGAIVTASGNDVLLYDGETLKLRHKVREGADDYWFSFLWDGFRPRSASLDVPVNFDSIKVDSTDGDTLAIPDSAVVADDDSTEAKGFIVSFAAFLTEDRAKELANRIHVGGENARIITSSRDGSTIYRVVLGPYLTKEEAERAGKESGLAYWVFEGLP